VLAVGAVILLEHFALAQEVPRDSWQQHPRSVLWALVVALAVALVLALRHVSVGCWLLVAGAAGNLVSWADDRTIPDYVTLTVADRWIAFNLPDAAILAGALAMITASAIRAEMHLRGRPIAS
jgi:lipoprotein signal peptidase